MVPAALILTCDENYRTTSQRTSVHRRLCRVTNPPERQLPIDSGAVPVAPGLEDSMASASDGSPGFRAPREYAVLRTSD